MTTVVKRAVSDQKRDESRQNNVIIYRAAESHESDMETRIKNDETLVKNLLTQLEVTASPTKIFRLGKFTAGENSKPRPIKLVFKDSEEQSQVMSRAFKLNKASEELKSLSISYDMNNDEREICRNLVKQAKKQ